MARLWIRESLFSDARLFRLAIALNSHAAAIGAMIWAWKLAQKHHEKNNGIIPLKEWEEADLPGEIITVGFAERVESGIKMSGN